MKAYKFFNSFIFNIFPLSYLLYDECFLVVGKLIFFRQSENQVEDLTMLQIDEYLLSVNKIGIFAYYKQFYGEYIVYKFKWKRSHADSRNSISLTLIEERNALEKHVSKMESNQDVSNG